MLTAQIEINASPAHVKAVFLDFESYPQWRKQAYLNPIRIDHQEGDRSLRPGDRLLGTAFGKEYPFTIEANEDQHIEWTSQAVPGLIAARHRFVFESLDQGKRTLLRQEETFTGLLGFTMLRALGGASLERNFVGMNEEIKARCESVSS